MSKVLPPIMATKTRRNFFMITKQHIAITTWAMLSKGKSMEDVMKAIPYVVLPDAIRMFVGQRQPSHFEKHPLDIDVSWMFFPEGEKLKNLSRDNMNNPSVMHWYLVNNLPEAVIGEESDIRTFDDRNYYLKHYHDIRAHLVQDMIRDRVLREVMIDPVDRFANAFTVRHSSEVIDGKELRAQIALFEELGFIKLVGLVYENTGVLLDKEWFDTYVQTALNNAYPAEMASNTYRFMKISEEMNQRIKAHNFELTQEERESVYMAEDLDVILDAMFEGAYEATLKEF